MTAGEAVRPGEKYAYLWNPKTNILWFATVRAITQVDVSDWSDTETVTRGTKNYATFDDLPTEFRESVKTILE